MSPEHVAEAAAAVEAAVATVIEGKRDVIRLAVITVMAQGHLLLEDVPGVGKTMLAKGLARAMGCSVRRIQFTPDLLPSDITGVSVYLPERQTFEFRPGAVFANVVIGDEINRAGPKTQSALLECMEERQVTVDGTTHQLQEPFIVIATQNPAEMEGTYPLPEAQRDRFMVRLSMGYPTAAAELAMLDHHAGQDPLERLAPVLDPSSTRALVAAARAVHASDAVKQYIVELVRATRSTPELRLGASPRAALHLLRAAKAHAAADARPHVLPDDVKALAVGVLSHRLLLSADAQMAGRDVASVVQTLLAGVPVPQGRTS